MKDILDLLRDIQKTITTIEAYKVDSYGVFLNDEKTQDAIMFNLIILGEAANRIPREYQDSHPEIPWSSLIGTRNVIVHGYDQIKLRIVWDIVINELDSLQTTVGKLIMRD